MPQSTTGRDLRSPDEGSTDRETSQGDIELRRKRARDRKSQQAMRDRQRGLVQSLTEQVGMLTRTLDENMKGMNLLETRIIALETENAQLRAQNAAWQLGLLGRGGVPDAPATERRELWQIPPSNTTARCLADSILQNFILRERAEKASEQHSDGPDEANLRPNPAFLLHEQERTEDEVSNVVGDLVRSYSEIATLPKQAAVFYVMGVLSKWLIYLNKKTWDLLPTWLRPTECQLSIDHAAWIDRIPWPQARDYLIQHPDITLDDFASTYSSSFKIKWDFDPAHVLIMVQFNECKSKEVLFNPVFESEIRQLKSWTVEESFRQRFPDIAALIDRDTTST